MRFLLVLPAALACILRVSSSTLPQGANSDPKSNSDFDFNTDSLEYLNTQAIGALSIREGENLASGSIERSAPVCTLQNALVRRDWASFTSSEKKSYINAVLCLQTLPSKTPTSLAPGAQSRYDDFAVTHINQTLIIHETGNFFGWHRYLVWTYEKALREECGYRGTQPYWNWGAHSSDQTRSPVFDGSSTSMSGDGEFVKHNGSLAGKKLIFLPSGNGGGCVKSGPFKDLVVRLGPNSPAMDGMTASGGDGLQNNPRCLRRDISNYASTTWLNNKAIVDVITQSPNISTFQRTISGRFEQGFLGIHSAGHFTIGGDADDLFSSPVDPAFWLHHTMLDRVWFIWQTMHPETGYTELYGTRTLFNQPPSPNTTLADLQNLGFNAGPIPLGSLMNTMKGPLCYFYV